MENNIYYHGSEAKELAIKHHVRSRYGFPAMFFTTNLNLASLYKGRSGRIWQLEGVSLSKVIDYNGKPSYSPEFRNYMYKLQSENLKTVLIKNVLDYPSKDRKLLELSDILIVFDLSLLTDIKPVLF